MPIRSLESYLFERKLASTSSIEVLQNATIGIDVEHYLSRIYTFKKEQYLAAIGGVPASLKDYLHSDLNVFKEFNIKPIFVISGLNIQLQSHQFTKANELTSYENHIDVIWNKIAAKQSFNYNSTESFRQFTDSLPLRPVINDLIKFFIEFGIDYMVAPYDASFQLSYLYQNDIIDTIYGSTDLLLTKVDKFILGMEFQSKDFRFIDKKKVLNDLHVTERQFLDLSIMVGCNLQPITFSNFPPTPKPNAVQPHPQISYIKLGLDIMYQFNAYNSDLSGFIANLSDPKSLDLYYKAHSAFKYLPVLTKEGYVELYSVEMAKLNLVDKENLIKEDDGVNGSDDTRFVVKVPNDVHDIISQRLPPEFYYYQSIGLLPLDLLESITKGSLDIRPPLEINLNDSYSKLINSKLITENLDYQYNLITQLLARYYQVKKIAVKYWYKDEVLELNNRLTPPVSRRVDKLFIQSDDSSEEFQLNEFFKKLVDEGSTTDAYVSTKEIKTKEDIVSTVFLRSLYLFDIINNKKELQSIGKIFKKFSETAEGKTISEDHLEYLFLILFLIGTKTLKLNEVSRDFMNVARHFKDLGSVTNDGAYVPVDLSSNEAKIVTLISRVFSLVRFNVAPINYQGPISKNLLNFRSHVKFLQTNLLHTVQCLLVDFLVHQNNNNIKLNYHSEREWNELVAQLPFFKDINNTLMGVISEIYFEYSIKQSKLYPQRSKQDIINATKDQVANQGFQVTTSQFNINVHGINSITHESLWGDLSQGVKFWNNFVQLSKIANEVDKTLINDAFYQDILSADEVVKSYI